MSQGDLFPELAMPPRPWMPTPAPAPVTLDQPVDQANDALASLLSKLKETDVREE